MGDQNLPARLVPLLWRHHQGLGPVGHGSDSLKDALESKMIQLKNLLVFQRHLQNLQQLKPPARTVSCDWGSAVGPPDHMTSRPADYRTTAGLEMEPRSDGSGLHAGQQVRSGCFLFLFFSLAKRVRVVSKTDAGSGPAP